MTSSSEINQRNPRHNQPNHPTGNQASHATGTKNLALTNKHTVEFSNNRHTPTQHHPTGQNLAWGNPSTLPGLPRLLNPGCSPWSSHRGLPRRGQENILRHAVEGFRPRDQPPSIVRGGVCSSLSGRHPEHYVARRVGVKPAPGDPPHRPVVPSSPVPAQVGADGHDLRCVLAVVRTPPRRQVTQAASRGARPCLPGGAGRRGRRRPRAAPR